MIFFLTGSIDYYLKFLVKFIFSVVVWDKNEFGSDLFKISFSTKWRRRFLGSMQITVREASSFKWWKLRKGSGKIKRKNHNPSD